MGEELKRTEKDEFISKLSSHLFWDIEKSHINPDKNKKWIVQRVLEYGLLKDWRLIHTYYGLNIIVNIIKDIRDIDPRSISFISTLANIPKEKFLCYSTKQSIPKYWNFFRS